MAKKVRLISGIILFAFLTSHLLNLSFGLQSLAALDSARMWFMWFWAMPVGGILLMASMAAHLMLGLYTLYRRNTLRMSAGDAVQLILGLMIFPLLFSHIVGTVLVPAMADVRQTYFSVLTLFWVLDPASGLKQVIVTVVAWIHGCMGLVIWMRIQRWWPRVAGFTYPLVIAIPLLALLGMVEAGKEVIELNKNPVLAQEAMQRLVPSQEILERLLNILDIGVWTYFAVLAAVLLARHLRVRQGRSTLQISYANGSELKVSTGLTILEISRMNDIPHASLCGGQGRCGTCHVKILEGAEYLPAPSDLEQSTLEKLNSAPDTRLACQVIPNAGAIKIERLAPAYISPKDLRRSRDVDIAPSAESPISEAAK